MKYMMPFTIGLYVKRVLLHIVFLITMQKTKLIHDYLPLERITIVIIYSQNNVHIDNINILYYDRIYVSQGIEINKTSVSNECDNCHYWYFLDKEFRFQADVCKGCHDVLMMSVNLNNIAISKVLGVYYRCIIDRIRKMRL